MYKKIFCLILCCIFICPITNANAQEVDLGLSSPSVVLIEAETLTVLYEENSGEIRACASITKVMTLILVMEALECGVLNYDDILYASAHASGMGGSDIWLEEGESMSVDDLIKATVIMSANDAAVVLAEAIAGSEDAFVVMMNEKAAELGMINTTFMNCNGLDEDGHLTTAYDIALMSAELIKYEDIFTYTTTRIDYVRDEETQLVNTNKMLTTYDGITGLKTGTTSNAGSCITATAERDGMSLIAVVLGAESSDTRFADATSLLNYGYASYKITSPEIIIPTEINVDGGMALTTKIYYDSDVNILSTIDNANSIISEIIIYDDIVAPIAKNQQVGEIIIKCNSETLQTIPILSSENIDKITFISALIYLLNNFTL